MRAMRSLTGKLGPWIADYALDRLQSVVQRPFGDSAGRVWVVIADHYEPLGQKATDEVARQRVARWAQCWPRIASRYVDAAGRPPRYCFFYPEEEYRPHLIEPLAQMTRSGIADVEIHIHHDGESEQQFLDRMSAFINVLHGRHGLLRRSEGKTTFGFIHGNWALDNSRPDGRWCGLNNEITLLRQLGCYADFTLPSAPSPMQARMVNTIYWATDDPLRPKSYDRGVPVRPNGRVAGDLLMIPGPLALRWGGRLFPRLEIGELAAHNPVSQSRVQRWLDVAPRIAGNIVIKLFAHGAREDNAEALLGGELDRLFTLLEEECARRGHKLHYATAWETYLMIDAIQNNSSSPQK